MSVRLETAPPAEAPSPALRLGPDAPPVTRAPRSVPLRRSLTLDATVDLLLVAFVLLLAAARLYGAHWYATYNPLGMRLLESWPASWEAFYFIDHLRTFHADSIPRYGIAPVDYRTYVNLYLFAQLYGWTGSAYWSYAAVDVFFWALAAVCTYHFALRLGIARPGAVAGAILVAGSPALVSFMWHQDLHLANMASLPPGLWAATALIQEHRSRARLAGGLALVLLYLSTTYQYQWFVAPIAFVLMVFHPALGLRRAIAVIASAVLLFGVATGVIQGLLTVSGIGPNAERLGAVQQPGALATDRARQIDNLNDLLIQLPGPDDVQRTAALYHPAVFWAGALGLALLGRRGVALALAAITFPLAFGIFYGTPWVLMTGYPLFYVGAGVWCGRLGEYVLRAYHALRGRRALDPASLREPPASVSAIPGWIGPSVALIAAFALFALTNLDLVGDPTFPIRWWGGPPIF